MEMVRMTAQILSLFRCGYAGYEVGDNFAFKDEGQFRMLTSSNSAEGNRHLQVASDSGVYVSNRNDRMHWMWPDANQTAMMVLMPWVMVKTKAVCLLHMAYTCVQFKSKASTSYPYKLKCRLGGLWAKAMSCH